MPEEPEPKIKKCLLCEWDFISHDPTTIRRCRDCSVVVDSYIPRTGKASADLEMLLPSRAAS